jgi:hypothetical protein
MALSKGTRLGACEIVSLLGAGGMGEVYEARDTRLQRTVAIKISAEQFSERFEREARAVAALNHPHICTLYDVDWSSDGRWIFYQTNGGEANAEMWLASVADRKEMPLLQTRFDTSYPALSPSGEYLAYSANDSGRSEIYVQRFQGGDAPKFAGARLRVSHSGGNGPRRRRDGRELFFLSPDRQITMAAVKPGTGTEFGPPAVLFRLPTSYRSLAPMTAGYEVTSDGQKFLLPIRKAAGAPLQAVVNWQGGLKQ